MNSNSYTATKKPARSQGLLPALGIGLLAALGSYFWLSRQNRTAQPVRTPMQNVVTAARDIPARTPLNAEMLLIRNVPAVQIPEGAFALTQDVIGKVTTRPVGAGQCLRQEMIVRRGPDLGLAYTLQPHKRAVTVAIDPIGGVAGLLNPGDHVDVLATFAVNGQPVVRTVLQNMPLLALGSQILPSDPANGGPNHTDAAGNRPPDATSATLMATPAQAQILVLSAVRGRVHLVLRPAGDTETMPVQELRSQTGAGSTSDRLPNPLSIRTVTTVPPPGIVPVARIAAQTASKPQPVTVQPAPQTPSIMVIKGTDVKSVAVKQ